MLGRSGERPGRLRQRARTVVAGIPTLVEDLPLDAASVPGLLGVGQRVLGSVLLVGREAGAPAGGIIDADRYDLDAGGHLWRRLGSQSHETDLAVAWARAVQAIG